MRINIDDQFFIEGDGNSCFTLYQISIITGEAARGKRPNPENIGKTRETPVAYYGNLRQALEGYSRYCVAMSIGTVDCNSILNKLDEINNTIKNLQII